MSSSSQKKRETGKRNPIGPKPRKNPLVSQASQSSSVKLADNSMTFDSVPAANGGYVIKVTTHRNNLSRLFYASSPNEKQLIIDTLSRGGKVT